MKVKKEYYSNLIFKNVSDNKTSWKTVKFFLSKKLASTKKTQFARQQEHHFNRLSDSCCFRYFLFSDFTKPYVLYPMLNDFSVPSIKSIVKYRNHTSTLAIGEVFYRRRQSFSSSKRDKKRKLSSNIWSKSVENKSGYW